MLSKSKFYKIHKTPSETFLASNFPLILKNPNFFSSDSLPPEGHLCSSDASLIKEIILTHRGSLFSCAQMEKRLDNFIEKVLQAKQNKGDHPKQIEMEPEIPVPSDVEQGSSKVTGGCDMIDLEHVNTLSIKNNPHQILVGGGFFLKEPNFSFKEQSESNDEEESSEMEDDEAFITIDQERVNNNFLEKSKDSITIEFESLLVTKEEIKEKKQKEILAIIKKDEELEQELGKVEDRKFIITYIGDSCVNRSDPLNMKEVVYFFDRVTERTCFLITNIWRNRVYQYYYFLRDVLPVIRQRIEKHEEIAKKKKNVNNEKKDIVIESRKSSGSNKGTTSVQNKKNSENLLSPLNQNLSRKSGEQNLRNNISINKNLSSISPSHVSNGSLNANSFFNIKGDTVKQVRNPSGDKNINSLGSSSKEENLKLRERGVNKKKPFIMDEYGVYEDLKKKKENKPEEVEVNKKIEEDYLLKILEIKPEEKKNNSKNGLKNQKAKKSLKSRLKMKKIKKKHFYPKKNWESIPKFHPNVNRPQQNPQFFGPMYQLPYGHPMMPMYIQNPPLVYQNQQFMNPPNSFQTKSSHQVQFNHLLQSDPNSLFVDYQKMKMGEQPLYQNPQIQPADLSNSNTFNRLDTYKSSFNPDIHSNKFNEDFSDNNSYTTSANFRLRFPNLYQKSTKNGLNFDIASPNIPTASLYYQDNDTNANSKLYKFNQSVADSGDYQDLDLQTINNSEQQRIFENYDRRKTLNLIPKLKNNFNGSAYYRDNELTPNRKGSESYFFRMNSQNNLHDQNQSRNMNFDPRQLHLSRSQSSYSPFGNTNPNSSIQIPLNGQVPKHVQEKFGSILVSQQNQKPFHRNSIASIPSEHPSLFQQQKRQRINSQYIFNPSSPMTPQRSSGKHLPLRKSFKVNSLPNIPNLVQSKRSIDKKDPKKSIFGLKSIEEQYEDKPERKISQSFDGQKEHDLFNFSRINQNQHKSQMNRTSSLNKRNNQSTSNKLSNRPSVSSKNKSSFVKVSNNSKVKTPSEQESSLFSDPHKNPKDARDFLLQNFRSFEVEDSSENLKDQQDIIFGRKLTNKESNKKILADLDIVLQKKINLAPTNLLHILSPEQKGMKKDLFVNSKSLRKESLMVGKSKSTFLGDQYKISPKIQKKKNNRKIRIKEKLKSSFQNFKLEKGQAQPNKASTQSKLFNGNPYPTSLDSSIRQKNNNANLFNFETSNNKKTTFMNPYHQQSLFQNSKNDQNFKGTKKILNLKLKKKIEYSASEKKLLSPNLHFLSPHPTESKNSTFLFNSMHKLDSNKPKFKLQNQVTKRNMNFFSDQKVRPNKLYPLTPNPKNTPNLFSQTKSIFNQNKNLEKIQQQIPSQQNYNQMSSNLQSTPPIRNSNIVSSSIYDLHLKNDPSKSLYESKDLFVPKRIPSKRLVNDLELSYSGAPSSSFITSNISGRHLDDVHPNIHSQVKLRTGFNSQNPFISSQKMNNFSEIPIQNNRTSAYNYPSNINQNTFLSNKDFALIIPQNNQIHYAPPFQQPPIRNQHDLMKVNMMNPNQFQPQQNLMAFLNPRGSTFQRQFEQKIFGNHQNHRLSEALKNEIVTSPGINKEKRQPKENEPVKQEESKKKKKKNRNRNRRKKRRNKKKKNEANNQKYDYDNRYYDDRYDEDDYEYNKKPRRNNNYRRYY